VKLFTKETIIPTHSNGKIYMIAPVLGLTMALMGFGVVPLGPGAVVVD
jgi:NADH-ubiquinone oxidoreductase chain 1